MTLKSYPVVFEIYVDGIAVGKVTAVDEDSAEITCTAAHNMESWAKFSVVVAECLREMELSEGGEKHATD